MRPVCDLALSLASSSSERLLTFLRWPGTNSVVDDSGCGISAATEDDEEGLDEWRARGCCSSWYIVKKGENPVSCMVGNSEAVLLATSSVRSVLAYIISIRTWQFVNLCTCKFLRFWFGSFWCQITCRSQCHGPNRHAGRALMGSAGNA